MTCPNTGNIMGLFGKFLFFQAFRAWQRPVGFGQGQARLICFASQSACCSPLASLSRYWRIIPCYCPIGLLQRSVADCREIFCCQSKLFFKAIHLFVGIFSLDSFNLALKTHPAICQLSILPNRPQSFILQFANILVSCLLHVSASQALEDGKDCG